MDAASSQWLSVVGVGEDGALGLGAASLAAIAQADVIFGSARQLVLLGLERDARARLWGVPLDVAALLAHRGQSVVALASGDPFHFGLGATLAKRLAAHEWRCTGASASAFSMMAARLGWAQQEVACLGLHAAPLSHMQPHLRDGARCLALVRDAATIQSVAGWLKTQGFGASKIWMFAALGGARERTAIYPNADFMDYAGKIQENADARFSHYLPVCVAIEFVADCDNADYSKKITLDNRTVDFPLSAGRSLEWFEHDGQITKPAVRALTLAALAPTAGAHLWDLGAGSGAVALEWCAASGGSAMCWECHAERAERIGRNAARFGLSSAQLQCVQADWGAVFDAENGQNTHLSPKPRANKMPFWAEVGPRKPDAIFIGGGLSRENWARLFPHIPQNTRVVVNAVTLENQTLLLELHKELGGEIRKFDYAHSEPLGDFQIWRAAATLLQWVWRK